MSELHCVLIISEGEKLEGAEELRLLGYSFEEYPSTKNEGELLDTRCEEFAPFIGDRPETLEKRHAHVRSLRATFIKMLEDSAYDDDELIIFGESDCFPVAGVSEMEAALRREVAAFPEADVFRCFYQHFLWNEFRVPPEGVAVEFAPYITGETTAHTPYVWGTHALVIPCAKRKKVADIFRTYRLPVDVALEAANSNGELTIRVARHNWFYQHPRS